MARQVYKRIQKSLEDDKKSRVKQLKEKMEKVEKVIGKQMIVIETLKNNSSTSRQREMVALLLMRDIPKE